MAVENGGAGTVSRRPTMGAHNLADHTRSQREAQDCTATLMSWPISRRRPHGASDFASSGMATSWRESLAGKSTSAHNWTHGSSRSFAGKQSRSTRIHEPLGPACRDGLVSKTGSLRHVFWTCRRRRHILTTCRKNRLSATRLNGRRGGRTCRTTICRLSHRPSTWKPGRF